MYGQQDLCLKTFWKKRSGRIKPKGKMHDNTPTQKIVGLNLCSVVVSFVR